MCNARLIQEKILTKSSNFFKWVYGRMILIDPKSECKNWCRYFVGDWNYGTNARHRFSHK